MKVNDTPNNDLIEYSKRLDNRLRNQNTKKEAEIENLKNVYEKRIEDTKTEGEDRYINSLKKNDELLVSATKDYEDKLSNYKDNLGRTQATIAQEEMALKSDHEQKTQNFKLQSQTNIMDQFQNAKANQEEIQNQVALSEHLITDKANAERRHLETTTSTQMNQLSSDYNQKSANEERQYRSQLTNDVKTHEADINLQRSELKKVMDKEAAQSKRLESEKLTVQKDEMTYLDNHQKDMLNQKQTDFKVRYENMVKEHNALIADLKEHLDVDVKKMVEQNAIKRNVIAEKAGDSFYKVETLEPKISETAKEYHVSLEVPEHEKENVHLSVGGRGVKMTLVRKFTDSFEDIDGARNKTTKNQLLSREFGSQDLLNPKKVEQKYENGVLSYRIQKL